MPVTKTYCPECDWIGEEEDIFCQKCGSKLERGIKKEDNPINNLNQSNNNAVAVFVKDHAESIPIGPLLLMIAGITIVAVSGMIIVGYVLLMNLAGGYEFFLVIGLIGIPMVSISTIANRIDDFYRRACKNRRQESTKKK